MQNEPIKTSEVLEKVNEMAITAEFATLFGVNISPTFSALMMQFAGSYFFTTALFLRLIGAGFALYRYCNLTNKNLAEKAGLGWALLQTGFIAAAIIGSIAAAATFTVIAPAIFVATMGADTLVNFALLLKNIGDLGDLRYSLGDQLKDPMTKLRYEKQKEAYMGNIGRHLIAGLVGVFITAACAVNFLFPHIGLATVTATVVPFLHTTIGGVIGMLGAAAMSTAFGIPLLVAGYRALKAKFFSSKPAVVVENDEHAPLVERVEPAPKERLLKTPATIKTAVRNAHLRFFNHREIVIEHIATNREDAKMALVDMIDRKITDIQKQIDDANGSKNWFKTSQEEKRNQKIEALNKVKSYLAGDNLTNDIGAPIKNAAGLLEYIDRHYPAVDSSLMLAESDTRNILKAVKAYERFEPKPLLNSVSRPLIN